MGLARRDDPRAAGSSRGSSGATARRSTTPSTSTVGMLAAAPDDAALRDEWLKLLLWDRRHRGEAIRELDVAANPADERAARELAGLIAEDPRRADEAAARYAALLERHPDDETAALGRARALARAGRREEARAEYARARPPPLRGGGSSTPSLAADPASHDAARREYEAVLRAQPRSRRARVGLARVLGARRETSKDAIAVYETVLADAPRDAEAHRGLAHAHAWNGTRIARSRTASSRAGTGRLCADVAALERSLRVGREPAVGGGARALAQPGPAALSRVGGFVSGAAEPTPFTSSAVEAGFAVARGDGVEASGANVLVEGAAASPGARLRVQGGIDDVRQRGRRALRRGAARAQLRGPPPRRRGARPAARPVPRLRGRTRRRGPG